MTKIDTAIKKYKIALISKAKRRGLYENFGQIEVRKLEDKFNYNGLKYGSDKERKEADKIMAFNKWSRNVGDEDLIR